MSRVRKSLKARREPYWGPPIRRGSFLGVRKLDDGTCTWIARWRDDENRQRYRAIGQVSDSLNFRQAQREAETWFDDAEHGAGEVLDETVKDACRAYVDELETDGRDNMAHDAETRFRKYVYDHQIARTKLKKLRTEKLKAWRNTINGSKANANRNWTPLRAALNLAVQRGRVNATVAAQWKAVKAYKDADGRREIYLDLKQRRALLSECSGSFRDLVEAAALTGARPGELASATRSQFEARTATLALSGKTGPRKVPLSPAAAALFKRVAKGKLPDAPLLSREDGSHWYRGDWSRKVRVAAEAAKLPPGVVLYTLRHCWITEALRGGMATLDVCRLVGTSLNMIEKNYGHLVVDSARERLAKVKLL